MKKVFLMLTLFCCSILSLAAMTTSEDTQAQPPSSLPKYGI